MRIRGTGWMFGVICATWYLPTVLAQPPAMPPATKAAPAAKPSGAYRKLVPGVMTTIPADQRESETAARHDIVELQNGSFDLSWTPKTESTTATLKSMATGTVFRRNVWCLEFSFKPLRIIWVDLPQTDGTVQKKLVWYLVYRVKNNGGHLSPTEAPNGNVTIEKIDHAIVNDKIGFMPLFSLESPELKTAYLDRIIPAAIPAIEQREDPNRKLLNSAEISTTPIPVSTPTEDRSVWGVATWEDIDPRIGFFSIYVEGLTNAYQWEDPAGKYKAGDPPGTGRKFSHKVLKLNFWRPGDEFSLEEEGIHYGMPDLPNVLQKYQSDSKVDYQWVYR